MVNRVLIKLPSRERPVGLLRAAGLYAQLAANKANTALLITSDLDDHTWSSDLDHRLHALPIKVLVRRTAMRTTKIEACNRDLPGSWPWDILLLASDDMHPMINGYDDIIRNDMATLWPKGDGCLWYHDGRQERICTMPIMDRLYYQRDSYVYHPSYASYCADDEQTMVASARGRLAYIPKCIIRHEHPCWNGAVRDDALYGHNRRFKQRDRSRLAERITAGFP